MSLVFIRKNGLGAFIFFDEFDGFNCDFDMTTLRRRPPADKLLQLSKDTLVNVAQISIQGNFNKHKKTELVNMILEKWEDISMAHSVNMGGCRSVFAPMDGYVVPFGQTPFQAPQVPQAPITDETSEGEEPLPELQIENAVKAVLKPLQTSPLPSFSSSRSLKVVVVFLDGDFEFVYPFEPATTPNDLMDFLASKSSNNLNRNNALIYLGQSQVPMYETIDSFGVDASSILRIFPKLAGGGRGRVLKKHLKRDEAMVELKRSVKDTIYGNVEVAEVDDNFPQSFKAFIEETKSKTNELQILHNRVGAGFVVSCLKQCPLDDLNLLKEILSNSKKHFTVEEKVIKGLTHIFPSIALLEKAKTSITSLKAQCLDALMDVFIAEFHIYEGGETIINLTDFKLQLDIVIANKSQQDVPAPDMSSSGCFVQ